MVAVAEVEVGGGRGGGAAAARASSSTAAALTAACRRRLHCRCCCSGGSFLVHAGPLFRHGDPVRRRKLIDGSRERERERERERQVRESETSPLSARMKTLKISLRLDFRKFHFSSSLKKQKQIRTLFAPLPLVGTVTTSSSSFEPRSSFEQESALSLSSIRPENSVPLLLRGGFEKRKRGRERELVIAMTSSSTNSLPAPPTPADFASFFERRAAVSGVIAGRCSWCRKEQRGEGKKRNRARKGGSQIAKPTNETPASPSLSQPQPPLNQNNITSSTSAPSSPSQGPRRPTASRSPCSTSRPPTRGRRRAFSPGPSRGSTP